MRPVRAHERRLDAGAHGLDGTPRRRRWRGQSTRARMSTSTYRASPATRALVAAQSPFSGRPEEPINSSLLLGHRNASQHPYSIVGKGGFPAADTEAYVESPSVLRSIRCR